MLNAKNAVVVADQVNQVIDMMYKLHGDLTADSIKWIMTVANACGFEVDPSWHVKVRKVSKDQ